MNKVNISHVNNMHNHWLRTLNFYKTEISILRNLLTEIAGKNTNPEMLKEVEHYENQFNVQSNIIDTIAHGIHVNIDAISKASGNSTAGYIDGQLLADHTKLGSDTEYEEKVMIDMIHSFRRFAATWM